MSANIEQIKSRLNIVDVVGSYLKLERAGGNFKTRCPFHNERTPSFFVSPDRDTFHCFGCNKGGDIFTFVQEMEGLDFPESLKILAGRAGIELVTENPEIHSEKGRLISAILEASRFYEKELSLREDVLAYLKNRGLKNETIKKFQIGFAPDSWKNTYNHLKKLGYTDKEIEGTGLVIRTDRGFYDRFRSRIMFSISNSSGTIIAFTGRIFSRTGETSEQIQAKYVNSPQTALYDKSKTLYGFDKARVAIRNSSTCILVEGQMDLIMAHQTGTNNSVAVSGTALTEEHLKIIKRLADKLVLSFDGDSAGIAAAERGIKMALNMGFDVRVLRLSSDKDPADLILRSEDEWQDAVNSSKHLIDFLFEKITAKETDLRKIIVEIKKTVLPFVKNLPGKMEQALFVRKISGFTHLPDESVWSDLNAVNNVSERPGPEQLPVEPVGAQKRRSEIFFEKIAGILFWQECLGKDRISTNNVYSKLYEIFGEENIVVMKKNAEVNRDRLIFEAELSFSGTDDLAGEVNILVRNFHEEILREKRGQFMRELKDAQTSGRNLDVEKYLKLCQDVSQELEKIKQEKLK